MNNFFLDYCKRKLASNGFKELVETENWSLQNKGKYFFTRNNTTIVAFTIGANYHPNTTGFKIIGAHTDSPCLRLSPISKLSTQNFNQACVQLYGGGLWHTWFDRDLTLAGRIIHKDAKGHYDSTLWRAKKALVRIPNLAIHLTTDRAKFEPNNESHLRPIFSTQVYENLDKPEEPKTEIKEKKDEGTQSSSIVNKHYKGLLDLITNDTGIEAKDIIDLDFVFADSQPAALLGIYDEFISSPRLDNLFSSYNALNAIIVPESVSESFVNVICLFDHEEIGSESAQGAASNLLLQNLKRIYGVMEREHFGEKSKEIHPDSFEKAVQNSFFISADMAHSIHPNYSEKHQQNHQPKINQGIVLKINANQRYATDGVSGGIIRILADMAKIPIQDFVVKNDSPCGSTIGPIVSAKTGIKTVDIGAPQLSMHSIREICGVLDAYYYDRLFKEFFSSYEKIDQKLLSK